MTDDGLDVVGGAHGIAADLADMDATGSRIASLGVDEGEIAVACHRFLLDARPADRGEGVHLLLADVIEPTDDRIPVGAGNALCGKPDCLCARIEAGSARLQHPVSNDGHENPRRLHICGDAIGSI